MQEYRYKLALGSKNKVCRHMDRVYNDAFRKPWHFDTWQYPAPWFPPLPGTVGEPGVRFGLFSRYPESDEFAAIKWQEGHFSSGNTSTVLVAKFDIDNDGQDDLVLMLPYMSPWRQGAEDYVWVLDANQLDLLKPIESSDLYGHVGKRRPALIHLMTLGFAGAWIRPFIYDGVSYLSVHESGPRQAMRVLKYKNGGANLGKGNWQPLDVETVCRFSMLKKEQVLEKDARELLFPPGQSKLSLHEQSLLTKAVLATAPGWNALVEEWGTHVPIQTTELDLNGDGVLEILVQMPSSRGAPSTDSLLYLFVRRGKAYAIDFVLPGQAVNPLPSRTNGFQDLELRRGGKCQMLKWNRDGYSAENESPC